MNASSVQKLLNKAKSIRSLQGFDDTQSIFTSVESLVQESYRDHYAEQLFQSPAYRKAHVTAAEDLLAAKLELLEEKYNLGPVNLPEFLGHWLDYLWKVCRGSFG